MKYNLPCAVVRDLLPSYLEGLTEPETTQAVAEHLDGCAACAARQAAMQRELTQQEAGEIKEVDYLKTLRRRGIRKAAVSVAATLAVLLLGCAVWLFVIGSPVTSGQAFWQVTPEENQLRTEFYLTDSATALTGLKIEQQNGTVQIEARKVLVSLLHSSGSMAAVIPLDGVQEVYAFGQLIWAEGTAVEETTARMYQNRTPYVGSASAVGHLTGTMSWPPVNATMELYTAEEPFGLEFHFEAPMTRLQQEQTELSGVLVLALVENLGEFYWSCPDLEGGRLRGSVTLEEVDERLPQLVERYNQGHGTDWQTDLPLKEYAASPASLQRLRCILGI